MQSGIIGNTLHLGTKSKGEPSKGSQRLGGKPESQGEVLKGRCGYQP